MVSFFTTKDPLDKIISETFPEKEILQTEHILTGWTNIVIEVTTNEGSYFFRFPRNPFWSRMIVKDAAVCNFVDDLKRASGKSLSNINDNIITDNMTQFTLSGGYHWKGLLYRRIDEAEMFVYGDYKCDGEDKQYK